MIPEKIPELLVPANNFKVLKYAVEYGADAVYVGGKKFNLRSLGGNFTIDEICRGVKYAHERGVKVYLTLNAVVHEYEMQELEKYIKELKGIELDGIIIADLGVMSLVSKILKGIKIHISTQSNITNLAAVKVIAGMGVCRVNLSREISYSSLKDICRYSPIEIEIFVHGALCISYSGRCMLSKYMVGRDANKGECAQSCRWRYYLMEEKRPNLFFPVVQDHKGTYIYNSRDLCLLEELDYIISAGVDSIKIEGRMKTENYVSLVTWVYRTALDSIKNGNFDDNKKSNLKSLLDGASHRNFTKGFMFLEDKKELEDNENVGYIKNYEFTGIVKGIDKSIKEPIIHVKNQFSRGQILDILQPGKYPLRKEVTEILMKPDYRPVFTANPNDVVIIKGLKDISPFSILRIKK
jgi:U32 family peptidase